MKTQNQPFEEILEESKNVEKDYLHKKWNYKLLIAIGIASLIILLGTPTIFLKSEATTWDEIKMIFNLVWLFFPFISALITLPIAIIPIKGWNYKKKFNRIFLILLLSIDTIPLFYVLIMGTIILSTKI